MVAVWYTNIINIHINYKAKKIKSYIDHISGYNNIKDYSLEKFFIRAGKERLYC